MASPVGAAPGGFPAGPGFLGGHGLSSGPARPAAPAGGRGGSGEPDPKLVEAAREFEAIFVAQLLRQARASARAISQREPAPGADVYEGWQDEAMARAIAAGRGLGLAEMIVRQLGGAQPSRVR